MRFLDNHQMKIKEVMTKDNLVTAPVGTTLAEAQEILREHKIEKLPIVDDKFILRGLITIKDIEKATKYPHSCKDKNGRLLCGAAIGVTADVLDRARALLSVGADFLVLDSAHGHSQEHHRVRRQSEIRVPAGAGHRGQHRDRRGCQGPHQRRRRRRQSRYRTGLYLHDPCSRWHRRSAGHSNL